MEQVLFVVWRESMEAMLVIGILNAWVRGHPAAARARVYLWGGVVLGLLFAGLLALALQFASSSFAAQQDLFQLGMLLAASGLIVHMVLWMRRRGGTLRQEIEAGLSAGLRRGASQGNGWGVLLLATIAVAREGSETVLFLYGTLLGASSAWWMLAGAGALGFGLALAGYYLLQLGGRLLSWRHFFRLTEVLLLFLAAALFNSAIDKLISLDYLPALLDPLWDSSAWLDDGGRFGGMLAALTGYRAQPALMSVLAYAAFWLCVGGLLRAPRQAKTC